ncbi:cupin domain-containing protein [Paractinoplanes brasiliensis]|uniref:Quercetin dioxygenase-like cupin family protein n=1 Tax=Paractinoplanes brasiliensis TaxID=52695 RepID=A0A4R6JNW6_9ACTN|nr:cupin domain-containing protein [Actinoplanes brasiliensis]TDO37071.1 quercetin dioxygenase-like cupin family protein [Actinoplanes brasiliensis]GID32235.1 hypothetical protein Abr02nite_72180 [Actinoplanes brasiliensis]
MNVQVPVPPKDDPIWTAARGFVARKNDGAPKHVNGGREIARVKVTADQTGGALGMLEMDVVAGFGNIPHAHGGEDEAFYVAAGEFSFINGSTTFDASPGDFVYIPRGTRHAFKNNSAETGTLMVFFTPGGAESFFSKYGDDPDPSGNPPPEWTQERYEAMGSALEAHRMILLPGDNDWA